MIHGVNFLKYWAAVSASRPSRACCRPTGAARPHFAPRAKHVIFLFMNGGMSQVDTFDPKPRSDEVRRLAHARPEDPDGPCQRHADAHARGSSRSTASPVLK